jgi:DnaJ domain
MRYCSCGELAEDAGNCCARCAALQTLELEPAANRNQVDEAYRTLVKVWHPDRFQHDAKLKKVAEDKLQAINSAYNLLKSPPAKSKSRRAARPTGVRPDSPSSLRTAASRRSAYRHFLPSAALLARLAFAACGILIAALVLKAIDSTLAEDPTTGRLYSGFKAGALERLHEAGRSLWGESGQSLHALVPQKSAAVPVSAGQPATAGEPDSFAPTPATKTVQAGRPNLSQDLRRRELGAAHPETIRLLPYITTGLTQDEVKAIAGAPTAATDDKLVYQGSELYFTRGKLTGWKLDAASPPMRIKLWPDTAVDPDLLYFAVGSTKSAVLAVQGTPTYLSENQFGYGSSRVYFQNNRVVGWKDDPDSVQLRVATQ